MTSTEKLLSRMGQEHMTLSASVKMGFTRDLKKIAKDGLSVIKVAVL